MAGPGISHYTDDTSPPDAKTPKKRDFLGRTRTEASLGRPWRSPAVCKRVLGPREAHLGQPWKELGRKGAKIGAKIVQKWPKMVQNGSKWTATGGHRTASGGHRTATAGHRTASRGHGTATGPALECLKKKTSPLGIYRPGARQVPCLWRNRL